MKRLLKITFFTLLAVVVAVSLWWTTLVFTFNPDEDLHPANLWLATQVHHALSPIGDLMGYEEAAYSVEMMYEVEPGETLVTEGPMRLGPHRSRPPKMGDCMTYQIDFTPERWDALGVLTLATSVTAHRDAIAAWTGAHRTVCASETPEGSRFTTRLETDIQWPPQHRMWLLAYPLPIMVPIEEGLLRKAAQASDEINFYTRVHKHELEVTHVESRPHYSD